MRIYRVTFENVAVTAAQDMVFIPGASNKMYLILRRWVGNTDVTQATAQQIYVRERYLPATVTTGSGGTTGITPSKLSPGDATCSITTAATNNTTKATTSGTAVILNEMGVYLYQGYDEPWLELPVGKQPEIPPSTAYVWELLSTASGTIHLSGGVEIAELG